MSRQEGCFNLECYCSSSAEVCSHTPTLQWENHLCNTIHSIPVLLHTLVICKFEVYTQVKWLSLEEMALTGFWSLLHTASNHQDTKSTVPIQTVKHLIVLPKKEADLLHGSS